MGPVLAALPHQGLDNFVLVGFESDNQELGNFPHGTDILDELLVEVEFRKETGKQTLGLGVELVEAIDAHCLANLVFDMLNGVGGVENEAVLLKRQSVARKVE